MQANMHILRQKKKITTQCAFRSQCPPNAWVCAASMSAAPRRAVASPVEGLHDLPYLRVGLPAVYGSELSIREIPFRLLERHCARTSSPVAAVLPTRRRFSHRPPVPPQARQWPSALLRDENETTK